MGMDVRQVRCFLAVVDTGGFTRAAEELYISQSAVSQTIAAMERELGVALFDRVGRRAILTDAGRLLIGTAREVDRSVRLMAERASVIAGSQVGEVRVVSQDSPGLSVIPRIAEVYSSRFPGVRLVVDSARRPERVLESVSAGRHDIGIAAFGSDPDDFSIEAHRVCVEPFVLISPPNSDGLAQPVADRVGRADLNGLRVIVGQQGTRIREFADALVAEGVSLHVVAEVEPRGTLVAMVLGGSGHAFVPQSWGRLAGRLGARVAAIAPSAAMNVWIIRRRGSQSPSIDSFIQVAHEVTSADDAR